MAALDSLGDESPNIMEAKDIVELDVSGERMAVKRSTLMLCKDSALARQVRARSRCRPTRSLFS